jgi:acetyl esterase
MRAALALSTLALLIATSASLAAEPTGTPHVYKRVDGRELRLYVTRPADWRATDRRPALVFFHGGGWTGGAPGQFTEHAAYFASRGLVCVQVQYRLLDGKSNEPPVTCTRDAKSAIRWIRGRAGELGIDPRRIASAGGSAGGHLAAFVGMVDGGDDPADDEATSAKSNAMLLFNPVFDNGPGGWGTKRVGDRYEEFSPLHNVSKDDPPAIVFLGSEDVLIPVKTLDEFAARMQKAGVRYETRVFEGLGHGFFNHGRHGNRPYVETVVACDRFLAKLGWLEGEPTLAE